MVVSVLAIVIGRMLPPSLTPAMAQLHSVTPSTTLPPVHQVPPIDGRTLVP